ncbi:MAG: flagellin, partial [Anaerolineae bacterium]
LDSWSEEINSIVDTTKWNGQKLLDGLAGFSGNIVTFQVGADTDAANQITLSNTGFGAVYTSNLGIAAGTASIADWTQSGAGTDEATGGTAVAAFTGLGELATGTYTLVVNAATSVSATMQLKDSAGNLVQLDADGTYGGGYDISATSRTLTLVGGVLADVDTGRGLNFDLANVAAADNFSVSFTYTRGGTYSGDVSNAGGARDAVDDLDTAINTVSSRLRTIGAVSGRLSFREETLSVAHANTEAAYNRIMNADMAYEQVEVTKLSILQQTSMAMLGQANQMPQNILSLFR